MTFSGCFTITSYLIVLFLAFILVLRQSFKATLNPLMVFFLFYYFVLNCMVNVIDLGYNFIYMGLKYEHDDEFHASFSYKAHQLVLIALLSLVSSQFLFPSFQVFKEEYRGLPLVHFMSIFLTGSLFFNFLFELTSISPETRIKVFRVELTKVFMTVVIFYFMSLFLTTFAYEMAYWVRSESQRRDDEQRRQLRQYENNK